MASKANEVLANSCHVFHLLKNKMTDRECYSAKRSEIAKAFRGVDQIDYRTEEDGRITHYQATIYHFSRTDDRIDIGCQSFEGKDYRKLRRWALAKKK